VHAIAWGSFLIRKLSRSEGGRKGAMRKGEEKEGSNQREEDIAVPLLLWDVGA